MAEAQPSSIVEGATTGDVDEEVPVAAKSAEDRKVAGALSKLDAREDESAGANGAEVGRRGSRERARRAGPRGA